jgi:hypothetical protein
MSCLPYSLEIELHGFLKLIIPHAIVLKLTMKFKKLGGQLKEKSRSN